MRKRFEVFMLGGSIFALLYLLYVLIKAEISVSADIFGNISAKLNNTRADPVLGYSAILLFIIFYIYIIYKDMHSRLHYIPKKVYFVLKYIYTILALVLCFF